MDPQQSFCPNLDCPARGHIGRGNIKIHDRKTRRYRCLICKRTFSERTGTPFLYAHTPTETITQVLTLIAFGCPIPAIEAAFGFQRRTVRAWLDKAGSHSKAIHEALVLKAQVLHQVQCDEIFVRTQHGWQYLFMALCVSTRLWLGAVVSPRRDKQATFRLAQIVRSCAQMGPVLVVCDGFRHYGKAFCRAFRRPIHTGRPGRPPLLVWSSLVVVQYVKRRRLVHLAQGTMEQFVRLWQQVGTAVVSTSYIERLNATFRERLRVLTRSTRGLARSAFLLEQAVYFLGGVYNFCCVHGSLGQRAVRTPAMAAGLVSERWTVARLLWYRVPPARWCPPRHRGPLSKRERALLAQWGS